MNAHNPVPGNTPGLPRLTSWKSDLQTKAIDLTNIAWTIRKLALDHGNDAGAQEAIISLTGVMLEYAHRLDEALDSVNEVLA